MLFTIQCSNQNEISTGHCITISFYGNRDSQMTSTTSDKALKQSPRLYAQVSRPILISF